MKVTAVKQQPPKVFVPVTLTFEIESESELSFFQAIAQQTSTGPEAINKRASELNAQDSSRSYVSIVGAGLQVPARIGLALSQIGH